MRGFANISRAAGLVGHVHEEQQKPVMRAIWEAADGAVPYDGTAGAWAGRSVRWRGNRATSASEGFTLTAGKGPHILSMTTPTATRLAAAIRQRPKPSLSIKAPMIAAKMTLVSRSTATGPMGATVMP